MRLLETARHRIDLMEPRRLVGRVLRTHGLTADVEELPMPVGSLVRVHPGSASVAPVLGEIVACDGETARIMFLGSSRGVAAGDSVEGLETAQSVPLGVSCLGRVLNGLGRPIDSGDPIVDAINVPVIRPPISPLDRATINAPMAVGVRALDCMTTAGRGQRLGILAGPGVGKSTLLGSIARNTEADISVIALIGERGREVGDFIERSLGPEGLARSVVVVATGDESPLMRVRAALVATAAAEMFRDMGKDVLLMMDSVTRFCQAQRQIGLAVGEPPATKGYTPSVFANLSTLLERAGNVRAGGSITGFYTVLVEGDDLSEPISDAARGILDGHIALSRKLANHGHYPAVDILESVSRVADDVCSSPHIQARRQIIRMLAAYSEVEELVNIGAYVRGSNPLYDTAIEFKPAIDDLLRQDPGQASEFAEASTRLINLAVEIGHRLSTPPQAKGKG